MIKVSFVLLAYNQSRFIESAIRAALEQDYENIEYIFSDDCSSDDTFEIIEKTCAQYPSKNIILNKNKKNVGIAENVNVAMAKATGELIAVAAGDDISLSSRVSKAVEYFNRNEQVSFLSFNDEKIDESGKNIGRFACLDSDLRFTLSDYTSGQKIKTSGASRVFRRSLLDSFNDLDSLCPTEDTPFLLRGLYLGDGMIINSPGIYYRVHDNSLSAPANIVKMNHERIKKQYLKDIETARKLALISDGDLKLVNDWIEYTSLKKDKAASKGIKKIGIRFKLLSNRVFLNKLFKWK
ncbi:glycosyltransferase family 2 protein [Vibrio campbellii]